MSLPVIELILQRHFLVAYRFSCGHLCKQVDCIWFSLEQSHPTVWSGHFAFYGFYQVIWHRSPDRRLTNFGLFQNIEWTVQFWAGHNLYKELTLTQFVKGPHQSRPSFEFTKAPIRNRPYFKIGCSFYFGIRLMNLMNDSRKVQNRLF